MRRFAVTVLLLLFIAGVGFLVLDRILHERTGDELATAAQQRLEAEDADVVIDGFPFLTQVAADRLDEVRLDASSITIEDVEISDVSAVARGITRNTPHQVEGLEVNATVSMEELRSRLADEAGPLAQAATLEGHDDGLLELGFELGDVELGLALRPEVDSGRTLALHVEEVFAGDVAMLPDALSDELDHLLTSLGPDLEGLPAGVQITRLEVTEDGIDIRLAGSDVTLR